MPAGWSVEAYWRAGRGHDGVALLTAADEGRRNRRTYVAVLPHVDVQDRPPYSAISTVAIGALVAGGFRKGRRLAGATCAGRTSARV